MGLYPIKSLDDRGRCCGRKPLVYKRTPHRFCDSCCASFHLTRNQQMSNWAFTVEDDGITFNHVHMERDYLEARPQHGGGAE